ncbi:class I SAM-dependent methyltransferase [Clostridium sp.]|uniref:class I SAM-dependent methyltransferase n=1 Tax=Clostridium sp. TaxID=1506 RepID=UPI003D6D5A99
MNENNNMGMYLNKKNKSNFIFNLIAPIYGLFYNYQKKDYKAVIDGVQDDLDFATYKNIIDIGCGTGALCSVLNKRGILVTGVDPVQRMVSIAAKKQENKSIEFIQASVLERIPFEDKSFDVSIASYVAHGLKKHERETMYIEMSRITKHLVIIYDYNEKRAFFTNIIEWMEGGDYFNFIRNAKSEMKEHFSEVRIINVGLRANLYICKPY